jgi:hypothetical protein
MEDKPNQGRGPDLPACATDFIRRVVRRMWYRRRARWDVQAELTAHFEDAVRECAAPVEKERKARELIEQFGDAKLLAALCHRAKKRCRPVWLKALVRSGQGLGVALLYCVLCALPTMLGRPTIRVNYAEWLSAHWRPAGQGVENAKVYYDKAAELLVRPSPELEEKMNLRRWSSVGYSYSDSDVQSIEDWLAKNQDTFRALRQGASTPHYWPSYEGEVSTPIEVSIIGKDVESLSRCRHVMFAFKQQIIWEARRGEIAKALDDCLVLRQFGRHLENNGTLNEQLVGVAIENISYDGILAMVQHAGVSAGLLDHVQGRLESGLDLNRQVIDLACEKALWYDHIQRTFTDDGKGGGHALSRGFVYASGDWRDNLINTLRFRYPDRRETEAMVERYFQWAQRQANAPPDTRDDAEPGTDLPLSAMSLFFSLTTPTYERVTQLTWRLKTHEFAVLAVLAIQRYCLANGSYPDSLDQLVKRGFLRQLPRDPYGSGPLTYKKTDQGFTLYSWGANHRDDGGQWGTDSQGRPRMWADNGDWVFWPAPEP